MPPAPMTAPRYRFRSGDAGVRIPLAVEQVAERGGVPLVDPEERDEDQTHPHRLGPEERGDVGRDRRHAKQHETNVLPQPGAQGQHDLLARAVLGAEVVGDAMTSQQADELHRSREHVRLSLMPSSARPNRVERPRRRASWPSAESKMSETMKSTNPITLVQRSWYANR